MATIEKNLDNKGNSSGFHAGSRPQKFGPNDMASPGSETKNTVGATSEPNKGSEPVNKKVKTPREASLNAVPMPNKKGREVKDSMLKVHSNEVGGCSYPNKIS